MSDSTMPSHEASRGLALIVDDQPINCMIMQALLHELGFKTAIAHDGYEAIETFERLTPDFVFMDVIMPRMDGLEAARRIKAMDAGQFTPIIFLTALDNPEDLHACIEAGGDDFLSKPIDHKILATRILSLERIKGLYQTLHSQHHQLLSRMAEEEENEALAQRVFSHALSTRNQAFMGLVTFSRPASTFSGDLILSSRLPGGGLRILLADFTGHGLAAAIGALPVSELFHTMSQHGMSLSAMLVELNDKLCRLLPDDRFMAAVLMDLQHEFHQVQLWSGGMPPVLVSHNHTLQKFHSTGIPLGIVSEYDFIPEIMSFTYEPDSRILIMSDGLLDVRDATGKMFEDNGFEDFINVWKKTETFKPALDSMLDAHCQRLAPEDDITLVGLNLDQLTQVFSDISTTNQLLPTQGWEWTLTCGGDFFLDHLDISKLLAHTHYLDSMPEESLERLQIVLAELYNNALEHGVFRLQSAMKNSPEGFQAYYEQRERYLASPPAGHVNINLTFTPQRQGGRLSIEVKDSGPGYDLNQPPLPEKVTDSDELWGRGLRLVQSLTNALTLHPPGNRVVAEIHWSGSSTDVNSTV